MLNHMVNFYRTAIILISDVFHPFFAVHNFILLMEYKLLYQIKRHMFHSCTDLTARCTQSVLFYQQLTLRQPTYSSSNVSCPLRLPKSQRYWAFVLDGCPAKTFTVCSTASVWYCCILNLNFIHKLCSVFCYIFISFCSVFC